MVKIICRDRQNLNEFHTDLNRYMFGELIWRSNNEARRTWTLLAMIIYTRSQHIPGDWTLRPHFHTRPRRDTEQSYGYQPILYVIAHNTTNRRSYNFMLISCAKRAGRRTTRTCTKKRVGKYLHMIQMTCIRTTTPDTMAHRLDPQILHRSPTCKCDRATQNYTVSAPTIAHIKRHSDDTLIQCDNSVLK